MTKRTRKQPSKNIKIGQKYTVNKSFIDRMCGEYVEIINNFTAEVVRERKNSVIIRISRSIPTLLGRRDEFNVMRMDFDEYLIPVKTNENN